METAELFPYPDGELGGKKACQRIFNNHGELLSLKCTIVVLYLCVAYDKYTAAHIITKLNGIINQGIINYSRNVHTFHSVHKRAIILA